MDAIEVLSDGDRGGLAQLPYTKDLYCVMLALRFKRQWDLLISKA